MHLLEDNRVVGLLATQAQAISRQQLLELGYTSNQIARACGREFDVAARGVYVERGSDAGWAQQLWVARLALPHWSALSHEGAGAKHTFEPYKPGPLTFRVAHGVRAERPGITLHQTRDPWMVRVQLIDGLLVTTPEQTICDLAATTRKARLRETVDDAFSRRILRPTLMVDTFDELRRQGKPGFTALGEILDDWRDDGKVPTRSKLERKTLALFKRFGGPSPIVAWPYPTREQVPNIGDFGFEEALLGIETDGRRWHDRIKQTKRDKERDANAARHGVQILRVLWEHVESDPHGTWQLFMDTRAMRMKQLGRDLE